MPPRTFPALHHTTWSLALAGLTFIATAQPLEPNGTPWHFTAEADYPLTRAWSLSAKLGLTQLQGDAAASPKVDKKNQTSYGLFANYRF